MNSPESLSGYTKEQEAVFDWADSHGFTPVTSEINDLLNILNLTIKPPELNNARTLNQERYSMREMVAFLCGEISLDGLSFGDRHPTERGLFWWRKHLRDAFEAIDHEPRELPSQTLNDCPCCGSNKNRSIDGMLKCYDCACHWYAGTVKRREISGKAEELRALLREKLSDLRGHPYHLADEILKAIKPYLMREYVLLNTDDVECAAEYAGIEPERLFAAMKFYNERLDYLAKQKPNEASEFLHIVARGSEWELRQYANKFHIPSVTELPLVREVAIKLSKIEVGEGK